MATTRHRFIERLCDGNSSHRDDALKHARSLEGKWNGKHNNEKVVAYQCLVGFCSAKWKVKKWTRKDSAQTVDYVLLACLTHDHSKGCLIDHVMCYTNVQRN